MKTKLLCLGILSLAVFTIPTVGFSNVTDSWNNVNGNWSTAGNWNLGQISGPTTNVLMTFNVNNNVFATNDLANLTVQDLTINNSFGGVRYATLVLNTNGFDVNGNLMVGSNGYLSLNGWTMTVGGLVQNYSVSGNGGVYFNLSVDNSQLNATSGFWNAGFLNLLAPSSSTVTLNIGGTDSNSAMASLVTMTNAVGARILYGNGAALTPGTINLNASTNVLGFVNNGTIINVNSYGTLNINALFLNDTNGLITTVAAGQPIDTINIWAMPTNRGTINIGNSQKNLSVEILHGDVVNQGTIINSIVNGTGVQVQDGKFINDTNGTVNLFNTTYGAKMASLVVNRGTMVISNVNTLVNDLYLLNLADTLTNEAGGTIFLARVAPFTSGVIIMGVSNLFNQGTITASGLYDGLTNTMSLIRFSGGKLAPVGTANMPITGITNMAGGFFGVTNGGAVGMLAGQFYNAGTVRVYSNSTFGVGIAGSSVPSSGLILGNTNYENDGTISLFGGGFGASILNNATGATLSGYGDVGRIVFTNLVGGFSRILTVKDIVNSGTIAPGGVLNVGNITNNSLIIGSGVIQSLNTTNMDDGTMSAGTAGGRIFNASGASIFASGGTLVLSNGLLNNSNAGTIGTTNGGTLQLGDGTLALANSGTLALGGGALSVGDLLNSGTIRGTGTVQSLSVTNSGTISPGNSPGTLVFSSNLTLLSSSLLDMELGGTNAGSYDRIVVDGSFTLGGTLTISNLSPYAPAAGDTFDLFDFTTPLVGTFSDTNLPTLGAGLQWDFSQFNSQGILSVVGAIPEPSSLSLVLLGAVAAGMLRHRRRHA